MNKMCVCEGRTQCIPKLTPDNYSKYKNKEEYTYTIILNKKNKKHIPKKKEKEKIWRKTTSILHIQINGLTL